MFLFQIHRSKWRQGILGSRESSRLKNECVVVVGTASIQVTARTYKYQKLGMDIWSLVNLTCIMVSWDSVIHIRQEWKIFIWGIWSIQQVFYSQHMSKAIFTKPLFCSWTCTLPGQCVYSTFGTVPVLHAKIGVTPSVGTYTGVWICEENRWLSIILWPCSQNLYFCNGSCWYSIILHQLLTI